MLPSELCRATGLDVSRPMLRQRSGALAALRLSDVGSGRCARVAPTDGTVTAISLDSAVAKPQI